jgi:hypothetical protein
VFGTVVAASDAVDTIGSTECSVEPPEVEGEWVAAEVVGGGADGTDVVAAGGDVLWTGSDGESGRRRQLRLASGGCRSERRTGDGCIHGSFHRCCRRDRGCCAVAGVAFAAGDRLRGGLRVGSICFLGKISGRRR